MWNTYDVPDDSVWTALEESEESVDEQDFEDLQLSRMGIDVTDTPNEWVERPDTSRVSEVATRDAIRQMVEAWTANLSNDRNVFSQEFLGRFVNSAYDVDTGSLHFGDEPPRGIDPVMAGLEGAEEMVEQAVDTAVEEYTNALHPSEFCDECGWVYDECRCDHGEDEFPTESP